jgi:hypothetical protein
MEGGRLNPMQQIACSCARWSPQQEQPWFARVLSKAGHSLAVEQFDHVRGPCPAQCVHISLCWRSDRSTFHQQHSYVESCITQIADVLSVMAADDLASLTGRDVVGSDIRISGAVLNLLQARDFAS